MKQFTKYFGKIFTALFILASLLPVNGNMMVSEVAAREDSSIEFDKHYPYKKHISDAYYRLGWELDVDFPKNDIHARWIFRIEESLDKKTWHLTDEFIKNIKCIKHGQIQITNGVASFNPNTQDYITCELPDFNKFADAMARKLSLGSQENQESVHPDRSYDALPAGILNGVCKGCIDPWMNGRIRVQPNATQVSYPIGYLKSLEPLQEEVDDGSEEETNDESEGEANEELEDETNQELDEGTYAESKKDRPLVTEEDPGDRFIPSDEDTGRDSEEGDTDEPEEGVYTVFEARVVVSTDSPQTRHLYTDVTGWKHPERIQTPSQNSMYNFWAGMNVNRFLEVLTERHESYPTPWINHWISVNGLPQDVDQVGIGEEQWYSWSEGAGNPGEHPETQEYILSNGAQIFYIGHNPETGEYFRGKMRNIGVDPGCIGHG